MQETSISLQHRRLHTLRIISITLQKLTRQVVNRRQHRKGSIPSDNNLEIVDDLGMVQTKTQTTRAAAVTARTQKMMRFSVPTLTIDPNACSHQFRNTA